MNHVSLLKVAIRAEQDIVTARQKTRALTKLLGFGTQDQARIATSVSELARNAYQYAGSGQIEMTFRFPKTLFVTVKDSGPGIQNLRDILNGTYVSATGMGVGLHGSQKIMDHFQIESKEGVGTTVQVGKELPKSSGDILPSDIDKIMRAFAVERTGTPFEEVQNQNKELMVALDELRQTQTELRALNAELAETNRGVVALYAELDEKAESLRKANEVKTSFLSNMTHEFRTPLSSIISLTRILQNRIDGELTPEQEKQVGFIAKSAHSLLEIVNDLLDLAKVEAGKISVNPVDFEVDEVLGGIRGVFRPLIPEGAPVELSIPTPSHALYLCTDQGKVSQILRNLVSNALKFTDKGTVELLVDAKAGWIRFEVKDSGIGIPADALDFVFEDFTQVESNAHRAHRGTGLGLPLSRKLARLLGGDLQVESVLGQGSTFTLTLPTTYMGQSTGTLIGNHEAIEDEIDRESLSFRCLIIDDDEPSRYVLRSRISGEINAVFKEAPDGLKGISLARTWSPDVIFLDLVMPELDGFRVLQTLESEPLLRDVPVIVNTNRVLSTQEREKITERATSILAKHHEREADGIAELRAALKKAGFDYGAAHAH